MKVLPNANMLHNFNSNHVNNSVQLSIPAVYSMDFSKCIKVPIVYYVVDSKRIDALYVFLCFYHTFFIVETCSDHKLQKRFPITNWI